MNGNSETLRAIVGDDPGLRAVLGRAALVAPTTTPVLITGESGTGKELVARVLHELGPSPRGPLVAVNCGALPRELAESELFGHERGAFTGAAGRRAGWFEEASGGTLVLDEVGELPLELQPKLLRVLETGRIRRVGGGEATVRVRVVALTLRDLEGEVLRRAFRGDLYYRLAGFSLALPPLRRRRGDIALLARHFLREIEAEVGRRELDAGALDVLAAADWPGNVRELRNVIRRAAIITQPRQGSQGSDDRRGQGSDDGDDGRGRIDAAALELPARPPAPAPYGFGELSLCDGAPAPPPAVPEDAICLAGRTFDDIEREVFSWALRRHSGSRRRAARALAIARSTFCDKVKRHGLGGKDPQGGP